MSASLGWLDTLTLKFCNKWKNLLRNCWIDLLPSTLIQSLKQYRIFLTFWHFLVTPPGNLELVIRKAIDFAAPKLNSEYVLLPTDLLNLSKYFSVILKIFFPIFWSDWEINLNLNLPEHQLTNWQTLSNQNIFYQFKIIFLWFWKYFLWLLK